MEKHENSQEFIAKQKCRLIAPGLVFADETSSSDKMHGVETDPFGPEPTGPDPLLSDKETELVDAKDSETLGKIRPSHADETDLMHEIHSKTVVDNFVATMAEALGTSREKQDEISKSVYEAMVSDNSLLFVSSMQLLGLYCFHKI